MTKDELITKQQLEIEDLKSAIDNYKSACNDARGYLCRIEQWSTKCPDFPRVAMSGIVLAMRALPGGEE